LCHPYNKKCFLKFLLCFSLCPLPLTLSLSITDKTHCTGSASPVAGATGMHHCKHTERWCFQNGKQITQMLFTLCNLNLIASSCSCPIGCHSTENIGRHRIFRVAILLSGLTSR
uniref:Secreted protein n=1 Tax=Cyanistes caeruleus TaxID=156563 RepID=A0A8C0U1E4_CYACU